MKTSRAFALGSILSVAAAIGLAAAQDNQKPPKPAAEKVTVEGCLIRDTPASGASSSRAASASMFRLTSINYMTSGTVVDKVLGSTTRPAELALVPSMDTTDKVDLGSLVNQKVELQGTITPTAPGMAAGAAGSNASLLTGPTVTVTSAKSIAKTCTQP